MQFKTINSGSPDFALLPQQFVAGWEVRRSVFGEALLAFSVFTGNTPLCWFFLYRTRMGGHKILMQPPFLGEGFYLKTESHKTETRQTRVKQVMRTIALGLRSEYGRYMIDFALPPDVLDIQPFLWARFREKVRFTYLTDLRQSEQELLQGMSTVRRKNIRDGEKQNFTVSLDTDFPAVISLVERSFLRQKHPWQKWVLENLLHKIQPDGRLRTVLISDGKKELAAAVFWMEHGVATYLFGGFDAESGGHSAGPLALWTGMKLFKEAGIARFDFDGSMVPDIEKYFRGFGGTLVPYFRISHTGTWYGRFLRWYKSRS